jgi:hypothetical protein
VQLTLGILAKISGSFLALAFSQLDGFAVPAPAQLTQSVMLLPCRNKGYFLCG